MLAIYKKELRSYFTSMIGYVFIAFLLVIIGIGFLFSNILGHSAGFEDALSSVSLFVVLIIPLLTMRLMAEENKQKTDQLLLTSPLGAGSIVVGKLLAVITIFGIGMAVTCIYPLILSKFGTVQLAPAYASIFGFVMLGSAYLSIGLYISSLTENQVVAAVISFIVFFFSILMDTLGNAIPTGNLTAVMIFTLLLIIICIILYCLMHNATVSIAVGITVEAAMIVFYMLKPTLYDGSVAAMFGWLSVIKRFDQFYYGIMDITGLIYYFSITVLFTFLTAQVIRKKRWS